MNEIEDLAIQISARFENLARKFEAEHERSPDLETRRAWIDRGHPAYAAKLLFAMAESGLVEKLGYGSESWLRRLSDAIKSAQQSGSGVTIWPMLPNCEEARDSFCGFNYIKAPACERVIEFLEKIQSERRDLVDIHEQRERAKRGRLREMFDSESPYLKRINANREVAMLLSAFYRLDDDDLNPQKMSAEDLRIWIRLLERSTWWLFITTSLFPRHQVQFRPDIFLVDGLAGMCHRFFPELRDAWEHYERLSESPFDELPGLSIVEINSDRIWISAEVQSVACRILAGELRTLSRTSSASQEHETDREADDLEVAGVQQVQRQRKQKTVNGKDLTFPPKGASREATGGSAAWQAGGHDSRVILTHSAKAEPPEEYRKDGHPIGPVTATKTAMGFALYQKDVVHSATQYRNNCDTKLESGTIWARESVASPGKFEFFFSSHTLKNNVEKWLREYKPRNSTQPNATRRK